MQYSYDRCGPLEAHHGIFGRKKGHPEYDVIENCCLMGKRCHFPKSFDFGTWLCEKRKSEGYNMSVWFKNLRHKIKDENYGQDDIPTSEQL